MDEQEREQVGEAIGVLETAMDSTNANDWRNAISTAKDVLTALLAAELGGP